MVVLFIFFVGALVFQLIAWLGVLGRVTVPRPSENESPAMPSISIIVCFRNEEERLPNYLPLLLAQQYPAFEVIAVDDFSTDNSAAMVQELAKKDARLKLVQPPSPTRPGKKDALTFGIAQAQNECLLLTDADCAPATEHWVSHLAAGFTNPAIEVVLGYSPYRFQPGWVNQFQRYETIYTALQYLGFAQIGLPYMGVGRNLAYRKSFFRRAGGLEKHAHLPGGDDDLLISHHAEAGKITWVLDPAAWMYSDPAVDGRDYLRRKYRHLGVGSHYPPLPKWLLAGLGASHTGVYVWGVCCLFSAFWCPVLVLMAARWWAVVRAVGRSSLNQQLPRFSAGQILRNDLLMAAYYLILLPAPLLGGRQKGGWA